MLNFNYTCNVCEDLSTLQNWGLKKLVILGKSFPISSAKLTRSTDKGTMEQLNLFQVRTAVRSHSYNMIQYDL